MLTGRNNGSDKGLVNSDEGGRLTEPVRQNPHRVILFDEFEQEYLAYARSIAR